MGIHTEYLPPVLRQMIRFNVVGVLNTAIDFAVFFLLNQLGVWYLVAQVCSYACGIINSYILNKRWTFQIAGTSTAEAGRFLVISLASLALSVLLVYLFHSVLAVALLPAKIAATLMTMLASFGGSKWWVFKQTPQTAHEGNRCL